VEDVTTDSADVSVKILDDMARSARGDVSEVVDATHQIARGGDSRRA
jgi:hypothetical protein